MKDTYKDGMSQDEKIVLDSIKTLIKERGISPSVEEIRVHAGKSFGKTWKLVERLEEKKEIKGLPACIARSR
jgi:SOS-response transcriptional repressor LexA